MDADERVPIQRDVDIVIARKKGREMAARLGFTSIDLALITTAISELARNIVLYAGEGEIALSRIRNHDKEGIRVVARDRGPGITDIGRALTGGYSTSGSLGLGLPGVRRLMDDMGIESKVGEGTTVTADKWKR